MLPSGAPRAAGFASGDEAEVAGRMALTRIDEVVDRYSGCLETGGALRERVERLREQ